MIILGSQSPRRREIFNFFSLPHQAVSPDFDEDSIPFKGDPEQYVCELAEGKAASLSTEYPEATIITADSIVFHRNQVFGKPKNQAHAFDMLKSLSGNWHAVYTGITVYEKGKFASKSEKTDVEFNPLTDDQIRKYHDAIHWQDKAGGYGIQTSGGMIIKQIKGCYWNVMGLPINTLRELLLTIGIDLWDYQK